MAPELSSMAMKLSLGGDGALSRWLSLNLKPAAWIHETRRRNLKAVDCKAEQYRIAAYFAASPKVAATEQRDANHCKQRWHKINDQVNKFCGAIEAATREKTSGQNENDVLKSAHEIFFNNHKIFFVFEHAWNELRNDQKWCGLKSEGSSKRRKCQEGSQSESSAANETRTDEEERPPGVKAAKGKKTKVEGNDRISEFQTMWSIQQQDLVIKERLSKMILLDSLLARKEPLADYEEALKKKLINELLSR
ncbi:glutathione S-transferase T3-like [Brassica napus]|uniref:glutathione S-transferase T3-like n=1 Tax=Brassica napus TaxID=3708 RepID=UPI00207AB1EC|nr:glutathione S-transferase T3-like [Brassica napus]